MKLIKASDKHNDQNDDNNNCGSDNKTTNNT